MSDRNPQELRESLLSTSQTENGKQSPDEVTDLLNGKKLDSGEDTSTAQQIATIVSEQEVRKREAILHGETISESERTEYGDIAALALQDLRRLVYSSKGTAKAILNAIENIGTTVTLDEKKRQEYTNKIHAIFAPLKKGGVNENVTQYFDEIEIAVDNFILKGRQRTHKRGESI